MAEPAALAIDRRALSAPALRAFFQIAKLWRLSVAEQMTLLGLSARALETDALFVSGLQRYEDPSAVRFGRPSPRRSGRSAAQVAPVGWRRRLAIIRRRR